MDEGRKSRLEARNALADPNRECGRLSSETRSVSKALRDVAASYVLHSVRNSAMGRATEVTEGHG